MIKISIITVCKNAEKEIINTIDSVLGQTYTQIEYVFVDGKSEDNTLSVIREMAQTYSNIKYISEPDSGIYNAMNKGITLCTGDYILFLNAGDMLYNKKVISGIVSVIKKNNAEIYYGNVALLYKNRIKVDSINYGTWFRLLMGEMPSHQCITAKKDLFENIKFDEKYSVRSDYDWIIRNKRNGVEFHRIDHVISVYKMFGFSGKSKQQKVMENETEIILRNNFGILYKLIEVYRVIAEMVESKYQYFNKKNQKLKERR